MSKNDGWAEPIGSQVVINHFEGDPEVWEVFSTEQEAKEEATLWNAGMWGKGFTYSAEWLKKHAEESKGKNEFERA